MFRQIVKLLWSYRETQGAQANVATDTVFSVSEDPHLTGKFIHVQTTHAETDGNTSRDEASFPVPNNFDENKFIELLQEACGDKGNS